MSSFHPVIDFPGYEISAEGNLRKDGVLFEKSDRYVLSKNGIEFSFTSDHLLGKLPEPQTMRPFDGEVRKDMINAAVIAEVKRMFGDGRKIREAAQSLGLEILVVVKIMDGDIA